MNNGDAHDLVELDRPKYFGATRMQLIDFTALKNNYFIVEVVYEVHRSTACRRKPYCPLILDKWCYSCQ